MKITIVGVGYVGLPIGLVFYEKGSDVVFYDKDKEKIDMLRSGIPPIQEKGVKERLTKTSVKVTSNVKEAFKDREIIFICVGTPSLESGEVDLSYLNESVREISIYANPDSIVVIKSTVPPEGYYLAKKILSQKFDEAHTVVNPEFLREGTAIRDAENPDRIVIGVEDDFSKQKMLKLYKDFDSPILITDPITASVIKYASNSFLATKLSFINEIANLCDRVGANIDDLAKGMGLDPRIGDKYLKSGIGFGGSCLPKDTRAFINIFKKQGIKFQILESVVAVNNKQYRVVFEKLKKYFSSLKDLVVTVLGLSFKPGTDDIRESVSLKIIDDLLKGGAVVRAHDFMAIENAKKILPNVNYFENVYESVLNVDAIIIATDWKEYRELDWRLIRERMRGDVIIDGRNLLDASYIKKLGFKYEGIGRR